MYVREIQKEGDIVMEYRPTALQVADGLTKPLTRLPFEKFRKAVGIESTAFA